MYIKILLLLAFTNFQHIGGEVKVEPTFCECFDAGHDDGFCYNNEDFCIPPVPPICPIPNIGEDKCRHGYQRGFLIGLSRRRQ